MSEKHFTSGKSFTIGLILLLSMGFALWLTIKALINNPILPLIIIILVFVLPALLIVSTIWFGTRYIVSENCLVVKVGPWTHSKIDINRITEIKRTNTILSSPANSLKRICIRYGVGNSVVISPKNEKEFIDTILSINSSVVVAT